MIPRFCDSAIRRFCELCCCLYRQINSNTYYSIFCNKPASTELPIFSKKLMTLAYFQASNKFHFHFMVFTNQQQTNIINPTNIKELQHDLKQRVSFFNEYYNIPNRRPFWQQFIIDVFVLIFSVAFLGLLLHTLCSFKNSQ